mmetsp:Transcript_51271/g.81958  ORF Transcript_51271/g.81958 Transcript_51271/m.81958 type:complete len:332 (+) Transcript_51271:39-1034(+)
MGNNLCHVRDEEPAGEVLVNVEKAFEKKVVEDVEEPTPTTAPDSPAPPGSPGSPVPPGPGLPPGDWDGKPNFEHVVDVMSEAERQHILKNIVLSEDPSSKHFAERHKAIRFATIINGRVQTFTQNYFLQDVEYNDFSGGLRRYYGLINEELFEPGAPVAKVVLNFAKYYGIPEKTAILIQIQTNFFDKKEYAKTRASVTGQGIHTDGADRAMLVCLHRGEKIEGAANVFHASLDGMEELCDELPLQKREGVYFKDNTIYHTVTRASRGEFKNLEQVTRTMMIMHAPAEIYMQGLSNPNNNLGANESDVKLRDGDKTERLKKRETMLVQHLN